MLSFVTRVFSTNNGTLEQELGLYFSAGTVVRDCGFCYEIAVMRLRKLTRIFVD